MNSLKVARFYIEPIVDYNIHGPSPVDNVPIYGIIYGLNMDKTQMISSQYQYSTLQDIISWFILNVNWQSKNYEFFKIIDVQYSVMDSD